MRPWSSVRHGCLLVVASLALALTVPSPGRATAVDRSDAGSTVTLGALGPDPLWEFTCPEESWVQTITGVPGQAVVPAGGGVVTAWSTNAVADGAGTMRLVFWRPAGPPWHAAALSGPQTLPASGVSTFPTRVPVPGGAVLGMYAVGVKGCVFPEGTSASSFGAYNPELADIPMTPDFTGLPLTLNITATVEPDVDHDGYGDVTQDLCPQSASAQVTCPAPSTRLKGLQRVGSDKVRFKFASTIPGSAFICAIDSHHFRACKSRFTKRFTVGKHVIRVAAVAPTGVVDPTPSTRRFRLPRS